MKIARSSWGKSTKIHTKISSGVPSYSRYCQAGADILESILDLNPELTANPHWDDNVNAELTIVERHPHRYLSGFVSGGLDAFVDWGEQDFQFTNQMGYTIMISCQVTESVVRVELIAVKDVDTPFEDHWSIVRPKYTEEEDTITYTIVRDVYDEEDNLIRRDSTETLDEMGCGTSVYYRRED